MHKSARWKTIFKIMKIILGDFFKSKTQEILLQTKFQSVI